MRPIAQLDGEAGFAEVFFEDVFVPDSDVLGAPGDGWRVAMSTAGNERGLSLRSPGRFCAAADRLVDLYRSAPDPRVADDVVDAWIKAQAYRLYTWGTVTRLAGGGDMGAAGSVNKVFWSELDIALHETALDLLGPEAELESRWLDGYTFALSGPIYAGTNEVQRNIVAERILGLPREEGAAGEVRARRRPARLRGLARVAAGLGRHRRRWRGPGPTATTGRGCGSWARLAELGVTSLAAEATPVELVVAFEALGPHAVPGPWVESVAYLRSRWATRRGRSRRSPSPRTCRTRSTPTSPTRCTSATRSRPGSARCTPPSTAPGGSSRSPGRARSDRAAFDRAVLATSAQLLGAGERLLADSVAYVKQRRQFGREIGSYQAIKHALADVRIALDFARPLVFGAALGEVSVSAAKVGAGDAAYLASRTGLQVHGAIGYTAELDLSLWITKVRALVGAWGTPSWHRARLLQELGAS